jgi:hypothetical protein
MAPYQGARSLKSMKDATSVFAVTKVRLDSAGRITHVLWGLVDTKSNRWVSPEVEAPVAEVVDAIHNGDQVFALFATTHGHIPGQAFVAVDHPNGQEGIELDGAATPGHEIHDIATLQD